MTQKSSLCIAVKIRYVDMLENMFEKSEEQWSFYGWTNGSIKLGMVKTEHDLIFVLIVVDAIF